VERKKNDKLYFVVKTVNVLIREFKVLNCSDKMAVTLLHKEAAEKRRYLSPSSFPKIFSLFWGGGGGEGQISGYLWSVPRPAVLQFKQLGAERD
jgi:hypothetical protein